MNNLNPNLSGLSKSATLKINEQVASLRRKGKKVFSFGLGQSPFPVPEIVQQALKENAHQKNYLPVQGLSKLREQVALFHQRHDGLNFRADDVMIGPGSKELMFILQLCHGGDLLLPTPSWVSYAPQAQLVGKKVHRLQTKFENDWQIDPIELDAFCIKKDFNCPPLFFLNYPSNPCGITHDPAVLEQIAKVAKKHKLIVLSDEIYGLLHHQGDHCSIARYYPEGTIVSSGLSKWCGAGGWRLGTFAFPPKLRWLLDAIGVVASETFTSVSAPIQYAAISAFQDHASLNEYLLHSRRILKCLGLWIVKELNDAGVRMKKPTGAFYLLPDFENFRDKMKCVGIANSQDMATRILEETGVATLPGSNFGLSESALVLRMSYVDFDGAKALEHSRRISGELTDQFVFDNCPNVVAGIRQLKDWLVKL